MKVLKIILFFISHLLIFIKGWILLKVWLNRTQFTNFVNKKHFLIFFNIFQYISIYFNRWNLTKAGQLFNTSKFLLTISTRSLSTAQSGLLGWAFSFESIKITLLNIRRVRHVV